MLYLSAFIAGCGGGGDSADLDIKPGVTLPDSGMSVNGIGKVKPLDSTRVRTDSNSGLRYVGDQILITFREATPPARVDEIVAGIQGEIVGFLNGFDDYQILLPDIAGYDALLEICDTLEKDPDVVVATPNLINRTPVSVPPDDPWGGCNFVDGPGSCLKIFRWDEDKPNGANWGWEAIKAETGWRKSADYSQAGNSVANIKVGIMEVGGFSNDNADVSFGSGDDPGLGSVQSLNDAQFTESGMDEHDICTDNLTEKDFCGYKASDKFNVDGQYSVSSVPDCEDGAHGMHVSGIIGAEPNNGKGIAGVAWRSSLYGFRIAQSYDIKAGVLWLAQQGVRVINMSFGVSFRSPAKGCVFDAVAKAHATTFATRESRVWGAFADRLISNGIDVLLVNAAGNEAINTRFAGGFASVPEAARKNILVVGALTKNSEGDLLRAGFSNTGEIDIYAPGVDILSAVDKGKFKIKRGTSMAAPFVSGTAAAMLSINHCLKATELRKAIIDSGKDRLITFEGGTSPVLNMANAIQYAISGVDSCTINTADEQDPSSNPATDVLATLTPLKVIVGVKGQANERVQSAQILVKRQKAVGTGEEIVTGLSTDQQGEATVLVEPGIYSLLVSAVGYHAENGGAAVAITGIDIVQGEPRTRDIEMVAFPYSISGVVMDRVTGEPIPNARVVLELGSAIVQDLSTDDYGRYIVGVPDDLDHGRVSIQAPGYLVDSVGFTKKELAESDSGNGGLERDVALRPLSDKIIPVEHGDRLYHLGNDLFEGAYNSQFQIPATGLEIALPFRISDEQLAANASAMLHLKAKGVQANKIKSYFYINDNKIDYLPQSPGDGSYEAVALAFDLEDAGLLAANSENILKIETAYYSNEFYHGSDHYDDFEITDIYLELRSSQAEGLE